MNSPEQDIAGLLQAATLTPEAAGRIKTLVESRVRAERPGPVWPAGAPQRAAFERIMQERQRQDLELFPDQTPGTEAWDRKQIPALIEESLEVMQAYDTESPDWAERYLEEATHLAAVGVKILEHIAIMRERNKQGLGPISRIEAAVSRAERKTPGSVDINDRGVIQRPGVFEQ